MKLPALVLVTAAGLALSLGAFRSQDRPEDVATQTSYYANGQVETECAVQDGRREGTCRRYFADGSKMAEGRYAAGRMEGEWTFWLRDGSLDDRRSGFYEAGEKVGG